MATTKKTTKAKAETTEKKRFTTARVGMTPAGPFAFIVEGNLTHPGDVAKKDDTLYSRNSMGISMSAFRLMALAEGTFDKDAEYPDNPFVDLVAFGGMAERLGALPKGARIAVAGKMSRRKFPGKDGAEHEAVQITVQDFAVLNCKAVDDPEGATATVPATEVYTKDGEEHKNPTACLVSGNIYSVGELGNSKTSGRPYLQFSVFAQEPAQKVLDKATGMDTKDKEYEEKHTIINVSCFGAQAEAMAKLLKKGMTVCLSGRISENVFEGKSRIQMSCSGLCVVKFPAVGAVAPTEGAAPTDSGEAEAAAAGDGFVPVAEDDDEDELPF